MSIAIRRSTKLCSRCSSRRLVAVAIYFLSVYSGSGLLGLAMHAIVRKTSLDLKFPLLRFDNYWYYLLRGEAAGFGRQPQADELPSGVYLSAVVEQGDGCYVYWGIVEDFSFDSQGQLDRVLITVAHRRPFQADRDAETGEVPEGDPSPVLGDERFYEVRGDYMSIRYADMKTLNLDYFWVVAGDGSEPSAGGDSSAGAVVPPDDEKERIMTLPVSES